MLTRDSYVAVIVNKKRKNVWDLICHSASMYYRPAFCMRDAFMNYSVFCLYSLANMNSCIGFSHCTCIQKTKSYKSYKGQYCYIFSHISTSSTVFIAIKFN